MATAMTIDLLPGGRGDCLWIECHRTDRRPWRLLFDGGMPETWPALRRRIAALPQADREIDLAVISHIDADHIGGMLPLFDDDGLGVVIGDVWFNGRDHLPDPTRRRTRSVAQGESLVDLLSGTGNGPVPPWNAHFDRGPVTTTDDGAFVEIRQRQWPTITLLSPTDRRLASLGKHWVRELNRVRRGEPDEPDVPAEPAVRLDDLEALAEADTGRDGSVPNGSSIAFLLEHRGASCLLTGDAHSTVLGAALTSLANDRGGRPISIDAYKVSHHGSCRNITAKLLALTPAAHYLLSTNGDRFDHPDDIAVARIITSAPADATLWFNYTNHRNARWNDPQLQRRYRYTTQHPGDGQEGVTVTLPARDHIDRL